ncbi:sushi, von Willebrand factor type A, EGF and pentraxin domain-containing protein 1-like isoform X2 [Montipora foliosa]|uniref:sushi, von Willebrand factor type A, EGF and pentraxin domain-containing protein 1-like isoform X2 n=1 Tax=Montipora foliosa TaxID=591990 RepID=UPI0035F186CB
MGTPPIVQFIITSAFVSLHVTTACPNVHDLEECKWRCYQDPNCVSVNIHTHKNNEGLYRCDLNNATDLRHGPEFLDAVDYFYHGADSACDKEGRCDNGGVCQSGYTDKGYRCVCPPGWKFAYCQQDIDECLVENHTCSSDAKCINTNGSYNCSCKAGYVGDGRNCSVPDPIAFFPLNDEYGTKEMKNRAPQGNTTGVKLSQGPNGNDAGSLFAHFTARDYSFTTGLYAGSIPRNTWHFVGASYDHKTGLAKLWVNAQAVSTVSISAGIHLATQDSVRMGVKTGDARYYKGRIAQMQVYNDALSEKQIRTIKQRTTVA